MRLKACSAGRAAVDLAARSLAPLRVSAAIRENDRRAANLAQVSAVRH